MTTLLATVDGRLASFAAGIAGISAQDLKIAMLSILATIPTVLAIAWLTTKFEYRITATHLEVTLFGFCVRRVSLADIRGVSARRLYQGEWGEQWWNTLKPSRRFLTIKRRSGWLRNFVITPYHRYIFRAELEQAKALLQSATAQGAADEDEDDEGEPPGSPDGQPPGAEKSPPPANSAV